MAMTPTNAAGTGRGRLQPVPDPDLNSDVVTAIVEHFEAREIDQLDPEHQFICTLLHRSAAAAAPVLELVEDNDVVGVLPHATLRLIRTLVTRGRNPDPAAVSDLARGNRAGAAVDFGDRFAGLDRYLIHTYTNILAPYRPEWAAHLVVWNAYRRAFYEGGTRIAQMADAQADIPDVERYSGDVVRHWRATRARLRALAELARTPPATAPPAITSAAIAAARRHQRTTKQG